MISDEFIMIFLFFLGAIFGSFSNVIIYRLPKGESIVFPGSHCQSCKVSVPWYHNIPILSYLILKGRCFKCKERFSYRYCLVELLTAILFVMSYYYLGWSWFLIEILIFIFGLVTVSFIDFDHYILPDAFTLSGIIIGLVGSILNPERSFVDSFLGVIMGGGFFWAIAYIYYAIRKQDGMGGGDIKLLAWIGAVLGWKSIPIVILSSSLLGTLIGLLVAMKSSQGLKSGIPFGPYLALGALIYTFVGQELGEWYIGLFIRL